MATSKKAATKVPAKKSAAKPAPAAKKAAVKSKTSTVPGKENKVQKSAFILPQHGDKVSPANGELGRNGKPLVFEVDTATGNEAKNLVTIKPVGNTYGTGQWVLVDRQTEVNY